MKKAAKIKKIEAIEDVVAPKDTPGRWKVRIIDDQDAQVIVTRKEALHRAHAINDGIGRAKQLGTIPAERDYELVDMLIKAANESKKQETGTGYNIAFLTTVNSHKK